MHDRPITWTLVAQADRSQGSARVDEQGRLHLTFATDSESNAAPSIELHATDPQSFGINANGRPWIEWSWIDDHIDRKIPNIDMFAEDTRPGKGNNRVAGGSMFGQGILSYVRYDAANGNIEESPSVVTGRKNGQPHTLKIGKDSNGILWFIADGHGRPSSVLKDAFEGDHSSWKSLVIRVRRGEPGEDFVFTSLKMGDSFDPPTTGVETGSSDSTAAAIQPPKPEKPYPRINVYAFDRILVFGGVFGVGLLLLLVFALRGR